MSIAPNTSSPRWKIAGSFDGSVFAVLDGFGPLFNADRLAFAKTIADFAPVRGFAFVPPPLAIPASQTMHESSTVSQRIFIYLSFL